MAAHPELQLPLAILGFTLAVVLVTVVVHAVLVWDADRRRARWAGRRARIEEERARAADELCVESDRFARDLRVAQRAILGGR